MKDKSSQTSHTPPISHDADWEEAHNTQDPQSLSYFVDKLTGSNTQRISESLGEGFVRLKLGEAEKRQALQDIRCTEDAVIEMLRNARDAGATFIFVATNKTDDKRHLNILDNGSGIPEAFHETIFEPRVTTKLDSASMDEWGIHGRGMALFSIAANADNVRVSQSAKGEGSAFCVQIDTTSLGELKDQSTLPDFIEGDEGEIQLGAGPNNIYKTCASFALSEGQSSCTFVGSPAEILASIRTVFTSSLGNGSFPQTRASRPYGIFTELVAAADGDALVKAAGNLGLEVSQRTAHRILSGEIKPVRDILRRLREKPKEQRAKTQDRKPHPSTELSTIRKVRLSQEDQSELLKAFITDVDLLQERYYLVMDRSPKLTFRNGRLRVDFHFDIDTSA